MGPENSHSCLKKKTGTFPMFYRYFLRRLYVCFLIFFSRKKTHHFLSYKPLNPRVQGWEFWVPASIWASFSLPELGTNILKNDKEIYLKPRFLDFHRFPRSGGSKLLSTHNFLTWSFLGPDFEGLLHQNLRLDYSGTPPQNPFMKLCEQETSYTWKT